MYSCGVKDQIGTVKREASGVTRLEPQLVAWNSSYWWFGFWWGFAMAARKLLESQRSGKYSKKPACAGYGLGSLLLLACGAAMVVFCFLFVDMKSWYDGTDFRDFILQRDTLTSRSSVSLPRRESEERTTMDGDAIGVVAANLSSEAAIASSQPADGAQELATSTQRDYKASQEWASEHNASIPTDSEDPETDVSHVEYVSDNSHSESQADVLSMPGNDRSSLAGCDLYHGQWVYDATYPLYRSRNCAFVDIGFRCEENGRPDQDFMKYRWRPHDCDMPRFDARDMLERLRNQRLLFVGDSLGRNQWESMLCLLSEVVQNKSKIYEVNGRAISKNMGELVILFEDYNCTVEYFRDPFLVPQVRPPPGFPANVTSLLKIDEVSWSARRWQGANVMVFNSGHWWSWEKIGRQGGRFYVKQHLTELSNESAFKLGVKTWALWMERNLDPATQVFFRSFAAVHFRGGAWNHGGHCHDEVKPLTDEEVKKEQPIPWTNKHIKAAIHKNIKLKRSAVEFMDVTTLTNYRADAHAGLYGQDTHLHGLPPKHRQDCSHFCLPGVPDTWNEVLYASLLARGQGAWGEPAKA